MPHINRTTFEIDRIEHIVGKTGHCIVYAYGTVEVTLRGETRRVAATRWQDNDILCGKALAVAPGRPLVITSTCDGREYFPAKEPGAAPLAWACE
jgi:hypothetical protein